MTLGKFIVIEGLEGAGKTTAISTISRYLEDNITSNVIVTREPGGTQLGEKLRTLLKENSGNEPISGLSELLIIYAARVQHVNQVIIPALNRGDWVICDRFELSTYAYQGGGRGIDRTLISNLSYLCLNQFKADLTFYLDISPQLGLERARGRGNLDRFEQESLVFFESIYQTFQEEVSSNPSTIIIDASQSLESVNAMLLFGLKQFLIIHARNH